MPTHVVRHDPAAARIAEIVTMRRQLCDEHVAIENQAAQLEDAMLRRLAKRRLARIETDIRLLEKRLTETIAAEADLARRYARLTSMPGVGPVLAFTLIALLPELGRMSRKQIAALVGLAPYDFDSGKLRGHRSMSAAWLAGVYLFQSETPALFGGLLAASPVSFVAQHLLGSAA